MQSGTIVSAAAVMAVGWMPALPPPWLLLCGALISALFSVFYRRPGLTLLCVCLGLLYGSCWGERLLKQRLPHTLEAQVLLAEWRVLEPPQLQQRSEGGQRQRFAARVTLLDCGVHACIDGSRRMLLAYYGDLPLRAGERWRGEVKLKQPRGLANPGSFNRESWLAQRRFAATGYVREQALVRLDRSQGLPVQQWRQRLSERLAETVPDPTRRGVLLALSSGDRSGLSRQDWATFQRYGLNHLLVISGLHVGLAAGLGFLLGRIGGHYGAHLLALLCAASYSALAGFSLPTLRALAMLVSVQAVAMLGRRAPPLYGFWLALLAVALLDPLASHGAGFWLSFGAVLVIFYLRHMWPALDGLRTAILVQAVLAPGMGLLAAYWYGGLGWLAPLVNLVAVPVLAFWLAPLCLTAALLPPLDALCWELAGWPVAGFMALDQLLAGQLDPWLRLRPSLPGVLGGLAGLLWLAGHRALPYRVLALPLLLLPVLPPVAALPAGRTELALLDVG
ncbi:MAG: ComEC/Rec2 family competence protein, partial [Halieaceae bacterium]|nr:ComEC/Rec2 family competence protein [Halieaceae bacterium]